LYCYLRAAITTNILNTTTTTLQETQETCQDIRADKNLKKLKMKKINMKWLLNTIAFIAVTIISTSSFAGNRTLGREDNLFTLKQADKNKVVISCNLTASNTEYYEIERSADNKSFKTVCMVFPANANEAMRNSIDMKDKVSGQAVVYYRLKKVSGNDITYTEAKTITLQ
jgi:predicted small secreted protein